MARYQENELSLAAIEREIDLTERQIKEARHILGRLPPKPIRLLWTDEMARMPHKKGWALNKANNGEML